MDEETLNLSVRKFLKKVGVTAQREIEAAFRDALANDRLEGGGDVFSAQAVIRVDALQLSVVVDGQLHLTSRGGDSG